MKWNMFPYYKVPIDYIYYDELGEEYVQHIGWIATPDMTILKNDHYKHLELVEK